MIASLAALVLAALPNVAPGDPVPGVWQASLAGPGGPVTFGLEFGRGPGGVLAAWLHNAEERLPVGRVTRDGQRLRLDLWPYESWLEVTLAEDRRSLEGTWIRTRGQGDPTRMPLRATAASAPVPPAPLPPGAEDPTTRWRVRFSSSDEDAVALITERAGRVTGTILTTVGDYRFLEGKTTEDGFTLCVFDGAHAFRFQAQRQEDGSLRGDFWSRDTWHETFTAVRDDEVELPDPYELSKWNGKPLGELAFPDLEGQRRSLDDEAFAGRARLIVLFGTWCPNCYDETRYLNELLERFGERGLAVLGLAFEFEDDPEAQAAVVRRYMERMDVQYPVLIAGPTDKAKASVAFPALDRVRAYPTTLFVDAQGQVQAVHTGFSGPATGARHQRLREAFEARIERLLGPPR